MLSKQYIEENQVLERYLAERLSEQEREELENYCAENPEILRDLEAIASIKMGAAALRRSGELKVLTTTRPTSRWRVGLALAASLLIAVVAGNYWLRGGTSQPSILAADLRAFSHPLSVAAVYQVQRTRSDVDAVVPLPTTGGQAIKLRLRPNLEPRPNSFRVDLLAITASGEARTPLGSAMQLELDGDGFISVFLDSARLHPGSYELKVSATAGGASNDFLIEVTPAAG